MAFSGSRSFSGNAVQSLEVSVLALGDRGAEVNAAGRCCSKDRLEGTGYKYGTDYELPTLGAGTVQKAI